MNEFTAADIPETMRDFQPEWALVLGSGLGGFVESLQPLAVIPYAEIAGVPASRVPGHAGHFAFVKIGETRAVIACGRTHLYEGFSAREVTAAVRWMAALGAPRVLLTNAAGTLNPEFAPGTWMMLSDHLNLTGTSPLLGGAHFVDMSAIYSAKLRQRFATAANAESLTLNQGVYAGLLGPQYETPAEVRMLRGFGADAVGMSTVLEAMEARALGLEVAAFSCLTNWAAGLGDAALSHSEVMETGRCASETLIRLLTRGLSAG